MNLSRKITRMKMANFKEGIQTFSPDYFALAMSTGIISIASYMLGYAGISNVFFVLNYLEFIVLSCIFILRIIYFRKEFINDLSSHSKGAGFLTIIAAFCILGVEHVLLQNSFELSIVFWYFSIGFWLILLYSFFVLVTIKKQKPSLESGLNGSWLLFVVSTQALSILGSVVHPHLNIAVDVSIFINLFFYLLGVLFYIILIGIIFYRTTFVLMKADEFKPSYWIDMGAAAITTLSGIFLIKTMGSVPIFQEYIPTLKVLSILFWIAGTWWIPAIIFLEIWRHKSISLKYNAGYWSLVFPLGVYTACTWQLAEETGFYFLKGISSVFIYLAWIAWLITFIAMCIKVIGKYFLNRSLPDLD